MDTTKELTYPLNKKKIARDLIGQIIILIGFAFAVKLSLDNPQEDWLKLTIYFVTLPLWIAVIYFTAKKLMSNKPGLIISPSGIVDNTAGLGTRTILWNNIDRTYIKENRSVSFLCLELYDLKQEYLKQGDIVSRIFKQIDKLFYKTTIHLTARTIDIDIYDMAEIISRYHQEHGKPTPHSIWE
jgi:hypothetical protein